MDKFRDFLKKNWLVVVVCMIAVLFSVVGIPLLINWAFTVPALCDFFAVNWEAKDALAYYGSALGFIGTVIFSGLALWQNHVIKVESDKHTDLLEQMEKKKNMPILYVGGGGYSGPCQNLSFNIYNLSDNIALDVVVSRVSILNKDGSEFWINEREHKYPHLQKESFSISLKNPALTDVGQMLSFQISFQDKFGDYHKFLVEGKQVRTKIDFPRFFMKEI